MPRVNHIKVTVFSKKGHLSVTRIFARDGVKGGAWVMGGEDNPERLHAVGTWATVAGNVKQLAKVLSEIKNQQTLDVPGETVERG